MIKSVFDTNIEKFSSKDKSEPAYLYIAKTIRRLIASGSYPPGSQLPSESQLRKTFKVSPMTIRRAINLLIDQDVVTTIQGRGTFVKKIDLDSSSFNLRCLKDLFGEPTENEIKLLQVDLIRADAQIASKLSVKQGSRIIYLFRVIKRDGHPILLHKVYLIYDPTIPIVESEMEVTKLMGLLEGRGITTFKKGEFKIKAAVLSDRNAELLEAPVGAAAIRLEHTFYDYSDRKMSWGWFLSDAEKLQFSAKVGIWN